MKGAQLRDCAKYRINNRTMRDVCTYPYEELIMLMVKRAQR